MSVHRTPHGRPMSLSAVRAPRSAAAPEDRAAGAGAAGHGARVTGLGTDLAGSGGGVA
ncbi:hypothetical protein AB0K21_37220 [Streptosporangium sp. NPDC049248]|uniref:hypothetical protein n=1 Tax=Streptosporangium sp. NPDC049248 TaxID=3155651 RepID=UPI00342DE086